MHFPTITTIRSLFEPSSPSIPRQPGKTICDQVSGFALELAQKAEQAGSQFSDLICNFFLPPLPVKPKAPKEPEPVGNFYDPDGGDNQSQLFKPIAERAVERFKQEVIPSTPQRFNSPEEQFGAGLVEAHYSRIHSLFCRVDHDKLLTALSNVELSEKFEIELSKLIERPNAAEQRTQSRGVLLTAEQLLPNCKSAEILRLHLIGLIEAEAIDSLQANASDGQSALNLKNHVKANSKQAFNGEFVGVLTGPRGVEKINLALYRALQGYTTYPTE